MPLTKSVGSRKGPLAHDLILKYGEDFHPLEELMVPLSEGDVSLSMIDKSFKNPVFRVNEKNEIEVFPGGTGHCRDFAEARRDHRALRESLDIRWAQDKAHFEAELREQSTAQRRLTRQLDEGYRGADTSSLRLGHIDDELSEANRRVAYAEQRLRNLAGRPKVPPGSYLALAASSPDRIKLGHIGRVVSRLRQRTLDDLGVLPRKNTCELDMLLNLEVVWR